MDLQKMKFAAAVQNMSELEAKALLFSMISSTQKIIQITPESELKETLAKHFSFQNVEKLIDGGSRIVKMFSNAIPGFDEKVKESLKGSNVFVEALQEKEPKAGSSSEMDEIKRLLNM